LKKMSNTWLKRFQFFYESWQFFEGFSNDRNP
jgi:hypothetical protein